MDANEVVAYLATLLNQPVDVDTRLRLSSSRRARFTAWLHARDAAMADAVPAGEFSVTQMFGGGARRPAAASPTVEAAPAPAAAHAALDLGVDIQSVDELLAGADRNDLKSNAELCRIFTLRELSYAQSRSDPAQTLAGVFAAKEAIRKCRGGAAIGADDFRAIEVLPDEHGRPLSSGYSLSISHSGGMAVAVAARLPSFPPASGGATPPLHAVPDDAVVGRSRRGKALAVVIVLQVIILCFLFAKSF